MSRSQCLYFVIKRHRINLNDRQIGLIIRMPNPLINPKGENLKFVIFCVDANYRCSACDMPICDSVQNTVTPVIFFVEWKLVKESAPASARTGARVWLR